MKKEQMVAVTNIEIKLKDKTITLTAEEAKLVMEELNEVFKQDKTSEILDELRKLNPIIIPSPYPVYPPIWLEKQPIRPYWDWGTWCGNTGDTATLSINCTNKIQ